MKRRLRAFADSLGELYQPRYGQCALWVVLAVSVYLSLEPHLYFSSLPKGYPVSISGYLLPETFLSNPSLLYSCKILLWLSAALWAAVPFMGPLPRKAVRSVIAVVPWIAYTAYTMTASIYWENLPFYLHKFVLPSWLLLIHALWYHFYGNEIAEAVTKKEYFNTPLYPRWTYSMSVYVIALLYTYSGISKLRATPDWGDGLSLQLWSAAFGDQNSPLVRLLVSDHRYATLFQTGVLTLECSSFLAIFDRRIRFLIGLGLLAFHACVDTTFHIDFRPNMVEVFTFFMPFFRPSSRSALSAQQEQSGDPPG